MAKDNQLVLAKTSFKKELANLKDLNNKVPKNTELNTVDEKNWMGVNKKVKASDFNELVGSLQDLFSGVYILQRDFIKEFDGVYRTFEKLDDEYIKAILISVDDAKTASQQAKEAGERAEKALEKVAQAVDSQAFLIDKLKDFKESTARTVKELETFKTKIEKIQHFSDIDQIWKDNKELQRCLAKYSSEIKKTYKRIDGILKQIDEKLEICDGKIENLQMDNQRIHEDVNAINEKYEGLLPKIKSLDEKCQNIDDSIEKMDVITKENVHNIELLQTDSMRVSDLLNEVKKHYENLQERFANESKKRESEIEILRDNNDRLNENLEDLKKANEHLEKMLIDEVSKALKMSLYLKIIGAFSIVAIIIAIVSVLLNVVG